MITPRGARAEIHVLWGKGNGAKGLVVMVWGMLQLHLAAEQADREVVRLSLVDVRLRSCRALGGVFAWVFA